MSEEMKKLTAQDGDSKDLVAKNVEKLKKLFPEIVTDGKIDFETLEELLGQFTDKSNERYSFTWNGKSKARKLAMTPSRGTLRPAPEESVNWDATENLFIEGDNLEVLKLLQRSYHKKVKMIYIDPPYNTGNDFVYPDDYKDTIGNYLMLTGQLDDGGNKVSSNPETSGRYHTDWLNMMYPRLKLARELLKDDGLIFISIDDNEVANLTKICDEIFGEENFISRMIWRRRKTQANLVKNIAPVHDFILVYGKSESSSTYRLPYPEEFIKKTFSNPDNDPRGVYQTRPLAQPENSSNPEYEITLPNGRKITGKWSCSPKTFKKYVEEDRLYIPRGGEGMPRLKVFLKEAEGLIPNTWLDDVATNEEGSSELKNLFGTSIYFDFPKPVNLINHLLNLGTGSDSDSLVLDFFAGSSTTAHAVMLNNIKEEKNNKFIMIQLPEAVPEKSKARQDGYYNICDISKSRIKKVKQKLTIEKSEYEGDLGFKVFKLDASNIKLWDPSFDNVQLSLEDSIENVKPDRSELDVLYEILLKYGLDLTLPIEERTIGNATVYVAGAGALILCLSDNIGLDVVEGIAMIKDELQPELIRVVFRDGGFKDDVAKTNAVQILKQHGIEDVRSI